MTAVFLADTWAWVAYFLDEPAADQVEARLREGDLATSIITVAELSDLYHREGHEGLEERLEFIAASGPILDVTLPILVQAGRTKWAQRQRKAPMGLADAIIYETARAHRRKVLTGESGFQGLPGVAFLD